MRMLSFLLVLFFLIGTLRISGQESVLVDRFTRLSCGEMMARLDVLLLEWSRKNDHRLLVIYYGHRYRRTMIEIRNGKPYGRKLLPAHKDDGLSYAKGIELYLLKRTKEVDERQGGSNDHQSLSKEQIVLINGGYKEEIEVELWLIPPGDEYPEPSPLLNDSDIDFGAKAAYRIPDYFSCYSGL